ncbi:hypothetical protein Lal_00037006 [Lupinus albus]|nr:hypothetical protein Lal_00023544 [Lupinus albus]KAF1855085.1 hypothetical protein Lal_00039690 [Lupinus albus]KAF1855266.1 hypothetical protein Lal_00038428 [Lupinus albus]KAF1858878.1 hypothetical protein Lal_00043013 [Lupinus albus]KAF1864576.1 hypothetical protein Lal_00043217 [Lupinus albus]
MEQSRPKRVKTSATRVRRREVGSPSARDRGDPYYSLILQETRMAKFQGRKPTYIRYVDLTWLSEQNFSFPHDMEAQGTIQFMELKGQVYPALVREFYANFRYKDGKYWSMISGNLFELNDEIFMNVGGLSSSGYSIGDCSWVKENFDPTEVYKSFLRGPHLYIQGQLTKAGSLSVENRLLHYIIAYILVQRNTNHAQPTVNDLRFMYAVKNNVMINWPEEILKIMNSVSLSQSKLLPYSIFISRIVDYLRIDVSDTIIVEYTDKDHLVGESLIHKMGIYKYGSTWQYQEDYTTFGLDLSDDDNQDDTDNQHATAQGEPSGSAPQKSAFGFDQLEAMEQRLNNRMDLHFQGLKDSYFAGMEQYEERQTAYSDNQFRELRSLIQSTAEAQNALFCSEFQKLSMLIRGDQNIVTSVDHTDDPHPPPQP